MEYRTWKKQNGAGESIRTSLLGYGCMRFPTTPEGAIDEPRAEALLNAARDAGVNYFDTAYPYHGGQSEPLCGQGHCKVAPGELLSGHQDAAVAVREPGGGPAYL
mgnify:CR=1 FL=1